jgi:hypothetical protein
MSEKINSEHCTTPEGEIVWVSTVKLGVDHGFGGTPKWYETMVFKCHPDGRVESWSELDCERYETAEEAVAGHAAMVEKWGGK